jgi:hypothetical protein
MSITKYIAIELDDGSGAHLNIEASIHVDDTEIVVEEITDIEYVSILSKSRFNWTDLDIGKALVDWISKEVEGQLADSWQEIAIEEHEGLVSQLADLELENSRPWAARRNS